MTWHMMTRRVMTWRVMTWYVMTWRVMTWQVVKPKIAELKLALSQLAAANKKLEKAQAELDECQGELDRMQVRTVRTRLCSCGISTGGLMKLACGDSPSLGGRAGHLRRGDGGEGGDPAGRRRDAATHGPAARSVPALPLHSVLGAH